jgi:membrane protease YdiL (CAAX protease family)
MLSQLSNGAKLVLLIGLLVSFLLISSLFSMVILIPFLGIDILNRLSSPDLGDPSMVNALKAVQMISMIGGLLIPGLLFAILTENKPASFLKINVFNVPLALVAGVLIMIVIQPVVSYSFEINSHLNLPDSLAGIEEWMQKTEDDAAHITDAFLSTTRLMGFLVNVFMIALLPALCEEILFRGVLGGLLRNWTGNTFFAVMLSALVFAAVHLQFYGFLPRFILGIVLGYLYFRSGSLWVPIMAHFTNNLLSVVIEFLYRKGITSFNADQFGMNQDLSWVLLSIVFTIAILYYSGKWKAEKTEI